MASQITSSMLLMRFLKSWRILHSSAWVVLGRGEIGLGPNNIDIMSTFHVSTMWYMA